MNLKVILVFCAVVPVGVVAIDTCHIGAYPLAAKTPTGCPTQGSGTTACHGPFFKDESDDYTGLTAFEYDCGTCPANTEGVTCKECASDNCNTPFLDVTQSFECTEFTHDSVTDTFKAEETLITCHATRTAKEVCNSPGEASDSQDIVDNRGCGPCSAPQSITDKTCVQCDGNNCNAPVEKVLTFECTNFKYDAKTEKFVAEKDLTTCKATKAVCNSNGEDADKDYKVQNAGCGPCVAQDKEDKKCEECDGDKCNSAATITAFLLPIIALVYTLF